MRNIYVMSDIHSCIRTFKKMLKQINFTNKDLLIIAGDLIDRGGSNNLELIKFIKDKENIILLRGNHEEFFLRYDNKELSERNYYSFGGKNTLYELKKMSIDDYLLFRNYINKTKLFYNLIVNEKNYFICHNGFNLDLPIIKKEEIIDIEETIKTQYRKDWFNFFISSDLYYGVNKFDKFIIAGHLPTININGDNKILFRKDFIDIDCGATYKDGRLGCLRLNDLATFYEEVVKKDLE